MVSKEGGKKASGCISSVTKTGNFTPGVTGLKDKAIYLQLKINSIFF